jgi:hypothetical protein
VQQILRLVTVIYFVFESLSVLGDTHVDDGLKLDAEAPLHILLLYVIALLLGSVELAGRLTVTWQAVISLRILLLFALRGVRYTH